MFTGLEVSGGADGLAVCLVYTKASACGAGGRQDRPPHVCQSTGYGKRRRRAVMKNLRNFIACLLTSAVCLAQTSDPRIGTILGELASVRPFKQVEISPDGKRVA